MFSIQTAEKLAAIFDEFHTPIFAAERISPSAPFRMLAANKAYHRVTGFDGAMLRRSRIHDLFSRDQAQATLRRYQACVDGKTNIRYFEKLTGLHGTIQFDTSLQHVPLKGGADRVIGISLRVPDDLQNPGTQMVFDDIRFFAALADIQLQNLVSVFDLTQHHDLFCEDSDARVAQLAGICRGIQQAITDIRETLHERDKTEPATQPHPFPDAAPIKASDDLGGWTLRALANRTRAYEDTNT